MFDRTALELIQETAVSAQPAHVLDQDAAARPTLVKGKGLELVDIEHLQEYRARFRGIFSAQEMLPFVAYTASRPKDHEYGPPQVFVDAQNGAATAYFNLGHEGTPGHADHRADLKLKPTAAFAALRRAVGGAFAQKALAEWLENWADLVQVDNSTVGQLINAVRNLDIKASRTASHQVGDLKASRSALEQIEASSTAMQLDGSRIRFITRPYAGFEVRHFELRIGVIADPDNPRLALRELAAEQTDEEIAQEFESMLVEKLPGITVLRGTFKP